MIPPSFLSAPESALAVTADPRALSDFSPGAADDGNAFSSFISQALNPPPANTGALSVRDQKPPLPLADANPSTAVPSDDANSNAIQWFGNDASNAPSQADSKEDHSHKSLDRNNETGRVDSGTENNLAALLAGQIIPTAKPPSHPILTAISGRPANSSEGSAPAQVASVKANTPGIAVRQTLPEAAAPMAGEIGKNLNPGTPNLATGLRPADGTPLPAKDSPQATLAVAAPPPNASDSTKATTQIATLQTVALIGAATDAAIPDAGTSAALDDPTMKFTGQKNETAGRTVQKLPHASSNSSVSSDSSGPSAGQLATTGSGRKSEWSSFSGMIDLTTSTAAGELHDNAPLVAGSSADSSATQVERVAHLVSQEAMTIRQSGANSLAVSLKVDQQTELFVQLTSHNGQIQASLRCERGNLSGLDGHWGQLQESLARQNVQLLPPADRTSFRDQAGTYSSTAGSRDFEQPSQNQRQQNGNLRAEPALSGQPANPAVSPKTKNKNYGRKGWESWA
jgi:hypothetical protein